MPYIKQERRKTLDLCLKGLTEELAQIKYKEELVGELNYCITKLLLCTEAKKYADYNKLIGVLECVKQEFYRRAVVPYEEEKAMIHGDVY